MTFSFLIDNKTLMWNSHLGGYRGILENLAPKPGELEHAHFKGFETNLCS